MCFHFCSALRASLAFRENDTKGNYIHRKLTFIVCQWHYVSICLSIRHPGSRTKPCNQYLLVVPSEELDFTIRSAPPPPTSTSNIISRLDMSCTNSNTMRGNMIQQQLCVATSRGQGNTTKWLSLFINFWHVYLHKCENNVSEIRVSFF